MAGDGSSGEPAAVEPEGEKQASFMGLPPELRVRIYEFLFSGEWVSAEEAVEQETENADEDEVTDLGEEVENKGVDHKGAETGGEDELEEGEGNLRYVDHDQIDGDEQDIEEQGGDEQHVTETEQTEGDEPETTEENTSHHCCSMQDQHPPHFKSASPKPIVCPCSGRLYPEILSVNKLIHKEAMPIFYASIELRTCLPDSIPEHIFNPETVLDTILRTLPASSLQYISKIVLAQTVFALSGAFKSSSSSVETDSVKWSPIWDKIVATMPNIKHVRVHLDATSQVSLGCIAHHEFAGVLRLPKPRSVSFELGCCQVRNDRSKWPEEEEEEEFKRELVVAILKRAVGLEKPFYMMYSGVHWNSMVLSEDHFDRSRMGSMK